MGRDQHGHAVGGEAVDLVPEFASRLGVDAGGGLVKQEEFRSVHDAGGEGQTLFPAAGEFARELVPARGEAEALERGAHGSARVGQAVEAGDEIEVLLDGEVLVERELLSHVADLVLDAPAFGREVEAEHLALARIEAQEAAHQADRRGLAGAVGAEETDDLAAFDADRDVVDDLGGAEGLAQVAHVDGGFGHRGARLTSTIWPGRKMSAPASGRASTR